MNWIEHDGYYTVSIGGRLECCVFCGKPIEYMRLGEYSSSNHHCSKSHESHQKSAMTKGRNQYEKTVPVERKLEDGFFMLRLSEIM